MKTKSVIALAIVAGLTSSAALAAEAEMTADDKNVAEVIIARVKAAATLIASEGEAGTMKYNQADTQQIDTGTYIFVWDCTDDVVVAHPVSSSRGIPITPLKDKAGKAIGQEMCAAAEQSGGSWVEYEWPKPVRETGKDAVSYTDESFRKVTYMLAVDGQPYQVGAGAYIEAPTVEQLDALLTN